MLKKILAYLVPIKVIGNEQVGYSAKCFGDRNYVWSTKRENAVLGCKQRRSGK